MRPVQSAPASITVQVPSVLQEYSAAGRSELRLEAASVREALSQLERAEPSLYRSVCDETGAVRRHINVFVNASHMKELGGLDAALSPGDVLTLLPAVSGGHACPTE